MDPKHSKAPQHPRYIIVSNRLPLQFDSKSNKFIQATGGLVSALSTVNFPGEKIWVGSIPDQKPGLSYGHNLLPITVDESLYDQYYNGMANDVLWPLFHYEGQYAKFNWEVWEAYTKVNRIFADEILKIARKDDLIWIHDYHLFMLAKYLKEKNKHLRIGFFLHIPFPSSEVFRQLPVRRELLEGVLSNDLIGFQSYEYMRHFAFSVQTILGIESNLLNITLNSHTTQLGVFPVSIDTEKFLEKKKTPEVGRALKKFRKTFQNRKLILGVDRLDYIKGIDLKLSAFYDLLKKYPEWRGKVTLLQVAVPTRQDVDEYIRTRSQTERLIGMINGKFAAPGYVPVEYMFTSIPIDVMISLYRLADILFVSSKRDGMNLVAMEYLVSCEESKPGVLLLSEFAGAASTLSHAIRINPWNTADTAEKIHEALNLSPQEKKRRFTPMLQYLKQYNSTEWARTYLDKLSKTNCGKILTMARKIEIKSPGVISLPPDLQLAKIQKKVIFFTDFDGTLAPIVADPSKALIDKDIGNHLLKISKNKKVSEVIVVSGRSQKYLTNHFKDSPYSLVCEHGAKYHNQSVKKWRSLVNFEKKDWYNLVESVMKDYCSHVPDSQLEKKEFSLTWHYRNSPSPFADYQSRKLIQDLESILAGYPVSILRGKKVVEVRVMEANKGSFIRWFTNMFFAKENPDDYFFIAIGDDTTDEEMFEAINPYGVSIRVGTEETKAKYYLEKQEDVKYFLQEMGK